MSEPLITKPGAYPDISASDYHRNADLLPGPSLSSSGAKKILNQSPYHFFWDSPLNLDRAPESDKPHFALGRAAHDMILLPETWSDHYHVTPEGFSRAKSKAMAEEIAVADYAIKKGKTVLSHEQYETVLAVAEALKRNDLAVATLTNGVTEETLVWRDEKTGVWLRARPDFRPHSILEKRKVMVVPDLKLVAPTHASPEGFGKAIYNFGYHQSAAWYIEGIKAIYETEPTHWVHIVVEKPEAGVPARHSPLSVSLYELPREDVLLGRQLNRRAINIFDHCLKEGKWPAYADEPIPVGMPDWARMQIEQYTLVELAWGEGA